MYDDDHPSRFQPVEVGRDRSRDAYTDVKDNCTEWLKRRNLLPNIRDEHTAFGKNAIAQRNRVPPRQDEEY